MPKRTYLIGVDLGTSATKAALYRPDGTLVAEASTEVPVYTPQPGVVEQENDDFYQTAALTVSRCIQQSGIDPREVAAIAFDSQMAGIGSVDEAFRPATRFDSWLDMRCRKYIEWMEREAGERITRLTGCPPTCNHGPKMLWWKGEQPEAYRRVAKFVVPAGYVAGRMAGLAGEQAFIDDTFIHFSGFADAQKGAWSRELCEQFGHDEEKLPRIVAPWEVIGEVNGQAARDFGLAQGTPIAAGAGDTAANALGAGIVQPGMLFDVAGTASVLASCTGAYAADVGQRALLTMRSVIPGLWHPLAYIAGGGLALRWFRDRFYNTSRSQPLPADKDLYDEMTTLAGQVPAGADGLLFSPHLGGRVCPSNPAMRGSWLGISWMHAQAHFLRALLESVAFEYAYYLRTIRGLLPDFTPTETRVIGGGARSRAWNQIKADALCVPYRRLQGNEYGTWGSALIAGKAAGLYDDLAAQAMKCARLEGDSLQPDLQKSEIYAPLIERYIQMQRMLQEYYDLPGETIL